MWRNGRQVKIPGRERGGILDTRLWSKFYTSCWGAILLFCCWERGKGMNISIADGFVYRQNEEIVLSGFQTVFSPPRATWGQGYMEED